MNEIRTYDVQKIAKNIYKNINNLVQKNIENGTLPYVNDNPFPQDMNVVNGKHFGDINKIELELMAAKNNSKSLKWIYGADAAFMNLELKSDNTEQIICYANVNNQLDSQSIYLIDQFTPASLLKAMNNVQDKSNIKKNEINHKKIIAQNMIKNISEYDSGLNEKDLRKNKKQNIINNFQKKSESPNSVENCYNIILSSYETKIDAEIIKKIFETLRYYYVKQETGVVIGKPLTDEQKKELNDSMKILSKKDSPVLTQTLSDSFFFCQRLTHYNFQHDKVFSFDDIDKKQNVILPNIAKFEDRKISSIENDISKEVEKIRDREIKPRTITHQRGV